MTSIAIVGTGHYTPGEPIPNDSLALVMETNDEWIRARTGIEQRYFAEDGQGVSDLGVQAARIALEDANASAEDVDYIVFATMTPEHFFPGSGPLLGAKLGIPGVPALDIRQQCAAIPYALQLSDGLVRSGAAETILLVGADIHAGLMPWVDWDTVRSGIPKPIDPVARSRANEHRGYAVVFGDGAGAMLLRKSESPDRGLIGAELHSDGRLFDNIYIPGVGFRQIPYVTRELLEQDRHMPHMAGPSLLKNAVHLLSRTIRSLCEDHDVSLNEIDWFIAHQANDRINRALRDALRVPPEKVPSNIARYGNTSAATIGILTDELRRDGKLEPGQLVCFLALGAGLNWGAALMRF